MLVLSRMRNQTIVIGDDIKITLVEIRGDKVRLGIGAPDHVSVHRQEVYDAIRRSGQAAVSVSPRPLGKRGSPHAPARSRMRSLPDPDVDRPRARQSDPPFRDS